MTIFMRFHQSSLRCEETLRCNGKAREEFRGSRSFMPQEFRSLRIENAVGDGGDLCHLGNIVDADDMRSAKDGCGHRGGSAEETVARRNVRPLRARHRFA